MKVLLPFTFSLQSIYLWYRTSIVPYRYNKSYFIRRNLCVFRGNISVWNIEKIQNDRQFSTVRYGTVQYGALQLPCRCCMYGTGKNIIILILCWSLNVDIALCWLWSVMVLVLVRPDKTTVCSDCTVPVRYGMIQN